MYFFFKRTRKDGEEEIFGVEILSTFTENPEAHHTFDDTEKLENSLHSDFGCLDKQLLDKPKKRLVSNIARITYKILNSPYYIVAKKEEE